MLCLEMFSFFSVNILDVCAGCTVCVLVTLWALRFSFLVH